jgi:hypothetical protein
MQTLTKRDYAKQSYLTKEAREEALIEQAKYEADMAIKALVELIGQQAAKNHVEQTHYLPF